MPNRSARPARWVIAIAVLAAGAGLFLVLREPAPVERASLDVSKFEGFDIGGIPRAVVTTSEAVWVARADRSVVKIDPETGERLAQVRLPFLPAQMLETEGTLWVGAIEGTSIAGLNLRTGEIVEQIEVGTTPQSLATDGKSLYVAAFDDGLVQRIDTAAAKVAEEVYAGRDAFPSAVLYAFGALWVSDVVADTVARLDPAGDRSEVAVGDSPTRLVAGEGAVWAANFNGRSVSRIDPQLSDPPAEILVGGKPGGLAVGDGYVWVLRPSTDSFVLIDAAAGRWTGESYEVADAPQDIAVGHGHYWIVGQGGTLTRVPPP